MGAPNEDGNCTSFDILDTEMLLEWHDEVKKNKEKKREKYWIVNTEEEGQTIRNLYMAW